MTVVLLYGNAGFQSMDLVLQGLYCTVKPSSVDARRRTEKEEHLPPRDIKVGSIIVEGAIQVLFGAILTCW